jgi:polysaccharide export outer membrane protein
MTDPDLRLRQGRFLARCLPVLLLMAIAACARPGSNLPPMPEATDHAYRLGPGDQVRVITFGEEKLSDEFRVSDSGNISLPLIGGIKAAGLTTSELEVALRDALAKAKLLNNPSVAVEVIAYRPIFVLGEVTKPGQFPYQPGMSVVTAVAVAGGFTYRAIDDYAAVLRSVDGHPVEGRAGRQTLLLPGDVVTVFERRF